MKKRYHLPDGRVQGVFSGRTPGNSQAMLRLTGWTGTRPDDRVETVFEVEQKRGRGRCSPGAGPERRPPGWIISKLQRKAPQAASPTSISSNDALPYLNSFQTSPNPSIAPRIVASSTQ